MSQALDYQVLNLIVQAGTDGIIKNVSITISCYV